MSYSAPWKSVDVDSLRLTRGQCLTVWLATSDDTAIQVELRVRHDGKPQLFTYLAELIPQDFEEWTAEEPEEPPAEAQEPGVKA